VKAKLNTNPKLRRYILLTFLLIFSLMTLSCGLLGGNEEDKSKATRPLAGSSGEEVQVASLNTLDSYRGRMTAWAKLRDGSESTETKTMEWVREPRAGHYIYTKPSGEIEEQIFMDDTEWTKVDGDAWTQRGSLHSQGGLGFGFFAYAYDIPLILPYFVPIDPALSSSLLKKATMAGEKTVEGIHCKHYVYDSPVQPVQFPVEWHLEIWVADQSDLPPVPVRLLLQQSQQLEDTDVLEIKTEINLYDFNAPITIEPPEGEVMQLPDAQPTEPPAGSSGDAIQVASLGTLDSYRGRLMIRIKLKDGSESTETKTMEWVREPLAGHYVHTKSNGDVEEQIVIGDTAWTKMGADSWRPVGLSHGPGGEGFVYIAAPIIHSTLSAIGPDGSGTLKKMTLMGDETVSGIHCRRYVQEESPPHLEIWVADQSDLPLILVRVLIQASPPEASSIHESETELILYDLNVPITIEPPQ